MLLTTVIVALAWFASSCVVAWANWRWWTRVDSWRKIREPEAEQLCIERRPDPSLPAILGTTNEEAMGMTRFEKIIVSLLSLQLLTTMLFAVAFFGAFSELVVDLRGDVAQINLELFRQGHPLPGR